ncbi:MAG: ATP-binding protein [Candidatus Omnitrophica bacterium]|nr:ATP-binding protein [Candidatus Omnitrophota bacterium]
MIERISEQSKNYARTETVSLLMKRVNAFKNNYRQNIAIIGYHSVGKTALILDIMHRCTCKEIVPIYINVRSQSLELLAKNFIGVLLYQYLNTEMEGIEDNLDFLLAQCSGKIPKTLREIEHINKLMREKGNDDELYVMLLELPQILYEETKKPVVLILDEFHHLDHLGLSKPFLELSNKIMVQKHTMYIVISSAVFTAQTILSKKLSLLFGNFEMINLQPFDTATAKEFLKKELGQFNPPEPYVNFLVYFTGGYPFYLSTVSEQIKNTCLKRSAETIEENILLESLEELLHKDHGKLNQYFHSKYHGLLHATHANLHPAILLAVANGFKKPAQISACINKKAPEINRHLTRLIQADVITKRGVFHDINDPLFVHWLKFVFCRQQNSFNMDIYQSAQKFTEQLKAHLNTFLSESEKDIELRVKELFGLFGNEIVELDKRRFMLTHFDEIGIHEGNAISMVNARHCNKNWLCCIEKTFVHEGRITRFLEETKRKDCIKKILITLDGMEANARLKALEAKVWIWDQHTLNELFSLFEKPRFIQ